MIPFGARKMLTLAEETLSLGIPFTISQTMTGDVVLAITDPSGIPVVHIFVELSKDKYIYTVYHETSGVHYADCIDKNKAVDLIRRINQ